MSALTDTVLPWLEADDAGEIGDLMQQVEWLGRKLYADYEPYEYQTFDDRFRVWISNVVDDTDRKMLFRLLDHIFFVGRREFEALCRATFNGALMRWLVDQLAIPIEGADVDTKVAAAIKRTWFCPITDSMRINAFLKVNHVDGKQHRPDWRSLQQFSDTGKIATYMRNQGLDRLVLMEDFVGSGTQIGGAVKFAVTAVPETQILLAPLVCCPKGSEVGRQLERENSQIRFEPVLEISKHLMVSETPTADEPKEFADIRQLTARVAQRFNSGNRKEPLGFKNTGALVVMYSNCPNNTLPVVHNNSEHWQALFPRIRRN